MGGFFPPGREIFPGHTGVWQGKAARYGGKQAAPAALSGFEYRIQGE